MEQQRNIIQGKIQRVIYRNQENFFTILSLDSKQIVKGIYVDEPAKGLELRFHGSYSYSQYGEEFHFTFYERVLPTSIQGIIGYLTQCKGVGKQTAQRIIQKLGSNCLQLIRDQGAAALYDIPKLQAKKAEKIAHYVKEQYAIEHIFTQLYSYGLTQNQIIKIYKKYGEQTLQIIQTNPYRLIRDIHGYGFKMADEIALKAGVKETSSNRIRAAILHVMQESTYSGGHVYIPVETVIDKVYELLQIDSAKKLVEDQLSQLLEAKHFTCVNNCLYLKHVFEAETQTAAHLKRLHEDYKSPFEKAVVKDKLSALESRLNVRYAEKQREAIERALLEDNGILVITGGPGTGKTTTVFGIVTLFQELHQNVRIKLAAPTGRAAKRLSEQTGLEAKTIHRLLEYSMQEEGSFAFGRDMENPIEADLIVIDETSMLDVLLAPQLFGAIPSGCKVLIIGDVNQIPSVGPGQVLKDIIESNVVSVVKLDVIYRQTGQSAIIQAAQQILQGKPMDVASYIQNKEFRITPVEDPTDLQQRIVQGLKILVDRGNNIMDLQVLAPMHKGPAGITELNKQIQQAINPPASDKPEWKFGNQIFRQGDKVIQTKNWADKEVYNGDVGRIIAIETHVERADDDDEDAETNESKVMLVDMNGTIVEYRDEQLQQNYICLAYCISIHKSQGSEYPMVIIPLLTSMWMMLNRNLYYTAVTRAKKTCITMGQIKALNMAIRRVDQTQRNTSLQTWLSSSMKE